ncbi:hypothetical protein ISF_06772 [Cordyceps fumosorosea ARSEF 2679]|uniref:Esterase-like protein n=1 Tax=Cordyceps fumosorosea (strain ARSEF 2679) TaxID=1081104 RepID=A0A167R365_CORFA|nr:hypothetical protein ISF_06772 [Cordyceps fumosorosea ARSEF 2679]OAA58233.1 hypothetical protein ISF_06772 [Cordyceps fumosorosea ARSEF 2679]
MKRCTTDVSRRLRASDLAFAGRRWTSHASASLTDEALLEKVGARLNDDKYGEKITLDSKKKTISTDSGELPMSPLFDPAWIKSRRRKAKEPPRPATGQFQKHLRKNPFAQALATPLRYCPVTKTHQPRYFLQRFDVIRHPETKKGWLAPSNDDYGHIQKNHEIRADGTPIAASASKASPGSADEHAPRVTGYVASQKSVFDALSGPNKRLRGSLLARRAGMSVSPDASAPVWRHDMSEVVLREMRREAAGELIRRAAVANHKFVQPCARWADVKDVERRGCILWLPRAEDRATARQHATFDVVDANYDSKMPVHNLNWLLGEEEVARLRGESDVFRDKGLLVLKSWPTKTMVQLHLLLWKLQGYLDGPTK